MAYIYVWVRRQKGPKLSNYLMNYATNWLEWFQLCMGTQH